VSVERHQKVQNQARTQCLCAIYSEHRVPKSLGLELCCVKQLNYGKILLHLQIFEAVFGFWSERWGTSFDPNSKHGGVWIIHAIRARGGDALTLTACLFARSLLETFRQIGPIWRRGMKRHVYWSMAYRQNIANCYFRTNN
jgi:hypothetical protein